MEIIGWDTSVDVGAIACSLDRQKWFVTGSSPAPDQSTWHVMRIFHRCRLLKGQEQACERIGSLAHAMWDPSQSLTPSPMSDRITLLQGQVLCLGSQRDNFIISQTARVMMASGRNPVHQSQRRGGDLAQIKSKLKKSQRHCSQVLEATKIPTFSGPRALAQSRRQRMVEGLPSEMPEGLRTFVESKMRQGTVQELPSDMKSSKQSRGSFAPSVLAEGIANWLDSKDGRDWKEHRDSIFKSSS